MSAPSSTAIHGYDEEMETTHVFNHKKHSFTGKGGSDKWEELSWARIKIKITKEAWERNVFDLINSNKEYCIYCSFLMLRFMLWRMNHDKD